jgi:hypothetical protein
VISLLSRSQTQDGPLDYFPFVFRIHRAIRWCIANNDSDQRVQISQRTQRVQSAQKLWLSGNAESKPICFRYSDQFSIPSRDIKLCKSIVRFADQSQDALRHISLFRLIHTNFGMVW